MRTAAGNEYRIDDDRLALDVFAGKVGLRSHADPDSLGGDAFGWRGLRARRYENRRQVDVSVFALVARAPAGRTPVGRQRVGHVVNLQAEALELVDHVLDAFEVRRRPREAAPPLRMGRLAVLDRDLGQGNDVALHARAVDVPIPQLMQLERIPWILVVFEEQLLMVAWQTDTVGLLGLGTVLHLGQRGTDQGQLQ